MKEEQEVKKIIDEQKEWQDHQYDPGHWLGGNIPPYLLRKNKKLGVAMLIIGFMGLILNLLYFSFLDIGQQIYSIIITALILLAGYSKLKGR